MRTNTRQAFNKLMTGLANHYGVGSMTEAFTLTEPLETTLNDKVQESSAFLGMINMAPVTDAKGQALQLGVDGMIGKRTDTNSKDRQPKMLSGPNGSAWETAFTEFDVGMTYKMLDQWARYKDFPTRYMTAVYRAIALTRLSVGFNGSSVVVGDSDSGTNTLGQDLNKGWLQLLKEGNAESYLDSQTYHIHESASEDQGYKSLDGLVADLLNSIPEEHRTGNEVAIVGSSLLAADSNKVYNAHGTTPSEKKDIATMLNSYGGLPALKVPKFPAMGALVTDPENLHLYFQEKGTRRHTEEQANRSRIVDFISSNDAYAIGNLKAMAAIDPTKVSLSAPA
jgi:P2 family phage major capsid protein